MFGIFSKKCPYCGGKNLYIRRTSPVLAYGCKDCDRKVEYLERQGLNRSQIEKIIRNEV